MRSSFFKYEKGKRKSPCNEKDFQVLKQVIDADAPTTDGSRAGSYLHTIIWTVATNPDNYSETFEAIHYNTGVLLELAREVENALDFVSLEDVPTHLGSESLVERLIAQWRIKISK